MPSRSSLLPLAAALPPLGERLIGGESTVFPGVLWGGAELQASTVLTVPLTLALFALAFVVVQWLVDRRDPKLLDAPARDDDDSVGFE